MSEIEIPFLGKLKTNAPAIVLSFVGLGALWLGYDLMKGRAPKLVTFQGEIRIDHQSVGEIPALMVGITSGSWMHTATPKADELNVAITVPNSWPSYSAYAFALGGARTKPALLGTSLENPKFRLEIAP